MISIKPLRHKQTLVIAAAVLLSFLFAIASIIITNIPAPAAPLVQRNGVLALPLTGACPVPAIPSAQISLYIDNLDTGLHPLRCDSVGKTLDFALAPSLVTQPSNINKLAWDHVFGNALSKPAQQYDTVSDAAPAAASGPGSAAALANTAAATAPGEPANGTAATATGYINIVSYAASTATTGLANGSISILVLNQTRNFAGSWMVVILWIVIVVAASQSGLLKDRGVTRTGTNTPTYSLSCVQMAWWFGIVGSAYIFLWLTTGDLPVINNTELWLMGISGGTRIATAGVDASQGSSTSNSSNFFSDILTDGTGTAVHRLQMLVMSVITGIVFIAYVRCHLAMPDFDDSTLLVLGISAGTYTGLKMTENNTATTPAAAAAAPAPAAAVSDDGKSAYSTDTAQP